MSTYTWKAQVQLKSPASGWQEVTVQADDMFRAMAMIESMYGKGSIVGGVRQVYGGGSSGAGGSSGVGYLLILGFIFYGMGRYFGIW